MKHLSILSIAILSLTSGVFAILGAQASMTQPLPCGPLHMMCIRNTQAQCIGTKWRCVPIGSSSSAAALVLKSLTPASGRAGMRVTVQGTGFSRTGNIVHFAESALPAAASRDGKHLTFTVPAMTALPCLRTSPYCKIAVHPYNSGTYAVSVQIGGRTSNSLNFTIVGSRSSSSSSSVMMNCLCPSGMAWDAETHTCSNTGPVMCPMYMVVGGYCGCDGKTYANSCMAAAAGVKSGRNCQ